MKLTIRALAPLILLTSLWAGTRQPGHPVPHFAGPTVPQSVAPGGPDFTLTVYGANFIPGSTVNWDGQPRATTCISSHELQAQILASDIAVPTAGMITVTTTSPNGPITSSTYFQVEVHEPRTTMGSTQQYIYPAFLGFLGGLADLTNDGSLDIVGVMGGSNFSDVVGSLMNTGTGQFYRGAPLTNRDYPYSGQVGFGDFNDDGNVDFVYVVGESRQITPVHLGVSFGDGQGHFTLGQSFGSFGGSAPVIPQIVLGDFNQDGALDVATIQAGQDAYIFLGNGNGTFASPTAAYVGRGGPLFVGDFNGDGKLDLLLAGKPIQGLTWEFKIAFGNGDGTFQSPKTVGVFPSANYFSPYYFVNDFNKDGKLDIAFANPLGQIGIMLGNGDGTFQPAVYYTVGDQTYFTFALGDFNSDGNTDIIVQQNTLSNMSFSILLGNGDGTFQSPQVLLPTGLFPGAEFSVADFNRDGLLDIGVPQYDYYVFLQQ